MIEFDITLSLSNDYDLCFASPFSKSDAKMLAISANRNDLQAAALFDSCEIFRYDVPTVKISGDSIIMSATYSNPYSSSYYGFKKKINIPTSKCDLLVSPLDIDVDSRTLSLLETTAVESSAAAARLFLSQAMRPILTELLERLSTSLSNSLKESMRSCSNSYSTSSRLETVSVQSTLDNIYINRDVMSLEYNKGYKEICIELNASTIYGCVYNSSSDMYNINICRHVLLSGKMRLSGSEIQKVGAHELADAYNTLIVLRG